MSLYDETLKAGYEKESRSVFGFFIRNYRFTYLIILAAIILGAYSLMSLPREANPEIKVPFAVVTTIYPGTNPSDVEELVTNKIEDKIKNLDRLRRFTSSSGIGFSSIFVEFDASADLKDSFQKLRTEVDNAAPNLPNGAETPVVTEINFNDFPIVTYSLVGDFSDVDLKKYADLIQAELENIKNVSKVPIIGGIEKEFQVIADQSRLANYNISLGQIAGAISRTNFNLPAGDIKIDGLKYNLRIKGKIESASEIEGIVITNNNGTPIYVADVAEVIDGYKEKSSESKIGIKGQNSYNTVSLQIFKKTGGNILEIIELAQARLDELANSEKIPGNLQVLKTNDNSEFIRDDLNRLGTSAIQTSILILFFLLVVLSFRGAVITTVTLPIAFLITFTAMYLEGQTINGIGLFALVLSLGLMVDNSIIIIEGISEYISKNNKTPLEAAVLAVWNYKWAIIAGTLTTVGAFLPMLLVSGILGQYMGILPKTITATLLSSLFVALVILPTLAFRFIKVDREDGKIIKPRNKKRHLFIEKHLRRLKSNYTKILKMVLPNKSLRRRFIGIAWLIFFASLTLPIFGIIKIEMFPNTDFNYVVANVKLPAGSSLDKTRETVKEAEAIIADIPELDNYVTNLGSSFSADGQNSQSGTHLASITINLADKDLRDRKSYEVADSLRQEFKKIQSGDITIDELSAGPPTGAPIEVRITGDDLKTLSLVGTDIMALLNSIEGTVNVEDNLQDSTGDFVFTLNKQQTNFYGLDTLSVANTLRSAVFGTEASEININGEDVGIVVKYNEANFSSIDDINDLLLFTPRGENIKLKQIANVSIEPSVLSINHRDGDKVVIITSQIKPGVNLNDVLAQFENKRADLDIPENVNISVGGEVEDIEQSFRELFLSMILAILIIAFILTLQFNSFKQPFIILFSLPLAIIGVMAGLVITRLPFSLPAFIGIVSLAGIAVNDAIVLIDKINKNLDLGMELIHGIIDAGLARVQPIFLTTATTVAGIFPLVFADELWLGLSVTVISGLLFSTFLTLIMIPIFYVSLCGGDRCREVNALIDE